MQETKKKDQIVPTRQKKMARYALYEMLLHFSRIGFVLLRKSPELRSQFSLSMLRRSSSAPVVVDDDDAPVVPLVTEEAGVEIPVGSVVEVSGASDEVGVG